MIEGMRSTGRIELMMGLRLERGNGFLGLDWLGFQ